MKVSWFLDQVSNIITIELAGQTSGWVGIGFSPKDKQMEGADIALGYINNNCFLGDFWSPKTGMIKRGWKIPGVFLHVQIIQHLTSLIILVANLGAP
jgi:hypothetical protein